MSFRALILAGLVGISGVVAQGSGQATWYNPGLGSCGITNTNNDFIVAVPKQMYDTWPGHTANPNLNPICGKAITASYNGKSIRVTVTDRCEACIGNDLDFTPGAFQALIGPLSLGRVSGMTWQWADGTSSPPPTTGGGSGKCSGIGAWSAGTAYVGGQTATYNGHLWSAKWWTQNEVPGGASGVWLDQGAC